MGPRALRAQGDITTQLSSLVQTQPGGLLPWAHHPFPWEALTFPSQIQNPLGATAQGTAPRPEVAEPAYPPPPNPVPAVTHGRAGRAGLSVPAGLGCGRSTSDVWGQQCPPAWPPVLFLRNVVHFPLNASDFVWGFFVCLFLTDLP